MPTHVSPPLLPMQWSSAYVSYWTPMQEDDQITSGYAGSTMRATSAASMAC